MTSKEEQPKFQFNNPDFISRYTTIGPPAFTPGHSGLLQMIGVLLAERVPTNGHVLVVGAGGGLDTRAIAKANATWHFVGVDPSPQMLQLAKTVIDPHDLERVELIEGTASSAPSGPFDAATLILVLGLIPDDGSKLSTLVEIRKRLKAGAPFFLVDQCMDRSSPDFKLRMDRYAAYAMASGVDADTASTARKALEGNMAMVPAARNEQLLSEAGFKHVEVFYVGMAWRGWVAYA